MRPTCCSPAPRRPQPRVPRGFEAGAHPYLIGVDNPDGAVGHVLPRVEAFSAWDVWPGRWGGSAGVLAKHSRGRLGGRSPARPARQGQKWKHR